MSARKKGRERERGEGREKIGEERESDDVSVVSGRVDVNNVHDEARKHTERKWESDEEERERESGKREREEEERERERVSEERERE